MRLLSMLAANMGTSLVPALTPTPLPVGEELEPLSSCGVPFSPREKVPEGRTRGGSGEALELAADTGFQAS